MKILISDQIEEEGIDKLKDRAEIDIRTNLDQNELKKEIKKYDGIIVRSGTKLNEEILKEPGKLEVIGRAGVGVDNIDISMATKKGITVINAPEASTISVAEHTLGLLLATTRNIPQANQSIKEKKWEKSKFIGQEVSGKTLGIFGLGRIGGEVAKRAKKLEMEILAFDPYISEERANELGVELLKKDKVLKKSDFITCHMPLTDETRGIISKEEFKIMKDHSIILNVARGGIIDEEALYNALKTGEIKSAALDVFVNEPPTSSKLLELENIVMTPHLGASTIEAQQNVALSIAEQVIDSLEGKPVRNALNLPDLPPSEMKRLKPFINLSEKIGSILAQKVDSTINKFEITFSGQITRENTEPIKNGLLKGFFNEILQEPVNFVKSPVLAKERNVKIIESKTKEAEGFDSLIKVQVSNSEKKSSISGTISGKKEDRVVEIDGYHFDIKIAEDMLITEHKDSPGVIGKVGGILGKKAINVGGMQVGRKKTGKKAMMVMTIDEEVTKPILDKIREIKEIEKVNYIKT